MNESPQYSQAWRIMNRDPVLKVFASLEETARQREAVQQPYPVEPKQKEIAST